MTSTPSKAKAARQRLKLQLFVFFGSADCATEIRSIRAPAGTIAFAMDVPYENGAGPHWNTYRVTHDATGTRCTCSAGARGRCDHARALRAYGMIPRTSRRSS